MVVEEKEMYRNNSNNNKNINNNNKNNKISSIFLAIVGYCVLSTAAVQIARTGADVAVRSTRRVDW